MTQESTVAVMPREGAARRINLALLAAVGIDFWFIVGFPFGNHNESYVWISYFGKHSFWNVMWTHRLPIATLRPLGQGLAYLGWQLSGGSSWPVQLFNFAVAAVAISAIAYSAVESATFALTMAIVGGTFFSGFLYLFHIHGVFYSPVLVVVALLLYFERATSGGASRRDLVAFGWALIVGLTFHPYALILYFAFMVGQIIEHRRQSANADLRLQLLLTLITVFAILVSRPAWHELTPSANLNGIVTSFRMMEVAPALSVLAGVFSVATALSIERLGLGPRLVLAFAVGSCAVGLGYMGLPVLMLWVAIAALKMFYLRRWTLAMMILAAAVLPGVAPSGSPTYLIFAVILTAFAFTKGFTAADRLLRRVDTRVLAALIFFPLMMAGALRMGISVPMVSRFAQPLIAEREKTLQLEAAIKWVLASPYRNWNLRLDGAANPIDSETESLDRTYRPPTYQDYLDTYLTSLRGSSNDPRSLLITFGGREVKGMTRVWLVAGKYAGPAAAYR